MVDFVNQTIFSAIAFTTFQIITFHFRSSLRSQQNYESELLTQRNGDDIRPLNSSAPNPNHTFSTTASTPQPAPRNQPPLLTARPNSKFLWDLSWKILKSLRVLGNFRNALHLGFLIGKRPFLAFKFLARLF